MKDLRLYNLNFQGTDLSFISKLESLEHLGFTHCVGFEGFVSQNCFGKKFHLSICHKFEPDVVKTVISSFGGKSLYKLTLNVITTEIIDVVKKFCPNISFLFIGPQSEQFQDEMIQAIQPICDLSLKLLSTRIGDSLVSKALGDYLKSVE